MKTSWNYCPVCGYKIEKFNVNKFFKLINKLVNDLFNDNFLTVFEEPKKPVDKNKTVQKLKKVDEPETKIRNLGDFLEIELNTPGIKSVNQVELQFFPTSLEIRAKKKDGTGYFKMVELPDNYDDYELVVNKGKTIIRLS